MRAARSVVPSSVGAGPVGWAPNHSSANGVPSGSVPTSSWIADGEPHAYARGTPSTRRMTTSPRRQAGAVPVPSYGNPACGGRRKAPRPVCAALTRPSGAAAREALGVVDVAVRRLDGADRDVAVGRVEDVLPVARGAHVLGEHGLGVVGEMVGAPEDVLCRRGAACGVAVGRDDLRCGVLEGAGLRHPRRVVQGTGPQ